MQSSLAPGEIFRRSWLGAGGLSQTLKSDSVFRMAEEIRKLNS